CRLTSDHQDPRPPTRRKSRETEGGMRGAPSKGRAMRQFFAVFGLAVAMLAAAVDAGACPAGSYNSGLSDLQLQSSVLPLQNGGPLGGQRWFPTGVDLPVGCTPCYGGQLFTNPAFTCPQ